MLLSITSPPPDQRPTSVYRDADWMSLPLASRLLFCQLQVWRWCPLEVNWCYILVQSWPKLLSDLQPRKLSPKWWDSVFDSDV